MRRDITTILCMLSAPLALGAQQKIQQKAPIIDMHIHAMSLADIGGGGRVCTNDQTI